jgi:hypothetical protein
LEVLLAGRVGNGAVLAAQITGLAGRWLSGITGRGVVATVGGQVAEGTGAISILRDRKNVDVIYYSRSVWIRPQSEERRADSRRHTERTSRSIWEVEEVDVEGHTSAVVVGDASDLALDGFLLL